MRLPLLVACLALLAGCGAPATMTGTTSPGTAAPADILHDAVVAHGAGIVPHAVANVLPVLFDTKAQMGEPTIGITKEGRILVASDTAKDAVNGFRTDILRSDDGGATWKDVSPMVQGQKSHPVTGDPMIWLDVETGRLFDMDQIEIDCDYVSTSDNAGDTWSPPTPSCPLPVSDHQTIMTGKPTTIPVSPLYPKMVYMCSNQLADTQCGRSVDGGSTFQVATPPFTAAPQTVGDSQLTCGALVGHLKAADDGTLYLPNGNCGKPVLAVTKDSMATWTLSKVSDTPSIGLDPTVAVGKEGTVYYTWVDDKGLVEMAASHDQGRTWGPTISLMPEGLTAANLPASAGGAGDRMVAFYYATSAAGGYKALNADTKPKDNATWDAYFTMVTNASSDHPNLLTIRLNLAGDPLFRGQCGPGRCPPGLYDFMDVQVDGDGRPWAVLVDGCQDTCATPAGTQKDSTATEGYVATLAQGPSLLDGQPLMPIHGKR